MMQTKGYWLKLQRGRDIVYSLPEKKYKNQLGAESRNCARTVTILRRRVLKVLECFSKTLWMTKWLLLDIMVCIIDHVWD